MTVPQGREIVPGQVQGGVICEAVLCYQKDVSLRDVQPPARLGDKGLSGYLSQMVGWLGLAFGPSAPHSSHYERAPRKSERDAVGEPAKWGKRRAWGLISGSSTCSGDPPIDHIVSVPERKGQTLVSLLWFLFKCMSQSFLVEVKARVIGWENYRMLSWQFQVRAENNGQPSVRLSSRPAIVPAPMWDQSKQICIKHNMFFPGSHVSEGFMPDCGWDRSFMPALFIFRLRSSPAGYAQQSMRCTVYNILSRLKQIDFNGLGSLILITSYGAVIPLILVKDSA